MKKSKILSLLLASILLVGCQGESVAPSTSTSGSDTSTSESSTHTSDSTSEEPGPGSDSTSEPSSEIKSYSLTYVPSNNDPADLVVDIYQDGEPVVDLIEESYTFEEGTALAVDPYTELANYAIVSVMLNGEALTKNEDDQYPFVMPSQDSEITIEWGSYHDLGVYYSAEGIAEMHFYEQESFDPTAIEATSAAKGTSIFAELVFNEGYSYKDYSVSVKNGETELAFIADYYAQGQLVYHFTMPDANVILDVTFSDIGWDFYFDASTVEIMESAYTAALTFAEIKEYVPFIPRSSFEFAQVYTPILDDGATFNWAVGAEPQTTQESALAIANSLESILDGLLLSSEGWAESSSSIHFLNVNEDFQVQVYVSILDGDGGTYIPSVRFSGWRYVAPTNWVEAIESVCYNYTTYQSRYDFVLSASEIRTNVPFFNYRFDDYYVFDSAFTSAYGKSYYAWALLSESSQETISTDLTALNEALAGALTTAQGWSTAALSSTITGYTKAVGTTTIYVYAQSARFNSSSGYLYYTALTFDADLNLAPTSWADYLSAGSSYEEQYEFAAPIASIHTEIPFFTSEYVTGAVTLTDSALTTNNLAWGVGVNGLATTDEQTAAITGMEAELAAKLGAEGSGWTATTVTISETSYTAYSKEGSDGKTYYVYVRGFTSTSSGTYGAYFIFDCYNPSWADYLSAYSSLESTYSFAFGSAGIDLRVPYWDSDYATSVNVLTSALTSGYYAWGIGTTTESAEAQATALAAMRAELDTNLGATGSGWTATTITIGEESVPAYYYSAGAINYYVYAIASTSTDTETGATTYSVYFVFDGDHPTAWTDLPALGSYASYPTSAVISTLEGQTTFTAPFATITEYVPYIGIAWAGIYYRSSPTTTDAYSWIVYYETSASGYSTDASALLSVLYSYLVTNGSFTFDSTSNSFSLAISETQTLVISVSVVTTNLVSSGYAVRVTFDLVTTTATA